MNIAIVVSLGCTSRATQGGGEKLCELVMVQIALCGRPWREALGDLAVPGGWGQGHRPTIITMLGILVVLCLIPAADVTGNRKNMIVSTIFQHLYHGRGETVDSLVQIWISFAAIMLHLNMREETKHAAETAYGSTQYNQEVDFFLSRVSLLDKTQEISI